MEKTHTNHANTTSYKVKLMCSYGGKIQPRPNSNHQLMYIGGDTKILTVDRNIKFSEIVTRLNSLCNSSCEFRMKYQLPGEDLDALVSLIDDDDVEHMMFEYDNILKNPNTAAARIRLFLFNVNNKQAEADLSPGSNPPLNPDFLFGFDKDYIPTSVSAPSLEKQNHTSPPPPLDLLQIPGMFVPEFSGSGQHNTNYYNSADANGNNNHVASGTYVNAAGNVYRIPVVTGGGQGGYYAVQGMVNWEQPVYNYVPAMASVPEQKMMMVSMGDQLRHEVKVNQRNV